jgi:glycosyltransferase involved in cell wall biosynthesis
MKIATNVSRGGFAGITVSNLALFDWLKDKEDTIVGIEIISDRRVLAPVIFREYEPSFFSHHIINAIDIIPHHSWEKVSNLRKKWDVIIEATKDILKQEAPDIVLINGTYNVPWIIAQAAKELGIPIVLRYAGVLQKEVGHKSFFVKKRLLAHEKWIASTADAVIFPSAYCQKIVENEIVKGPIKKGYILPNPVKKFTVHVRRQKKVRYTIAAVGRWSYIKNFQAYIALHNELLKEKWPHRAILVTSKVDESFGFPETMEQKKSMSYQEILKFYKSVDLVVVPSHFETFCNVAAEAVVSGTTVLVSKNVGFSDVLIKAGLKRMVIDSFDDPVKVADAVKKLAKTKLSQKEIKKVTSLLDPQDIHQKILSVLNSVISL